jgi:hypothetical protein
LGVDGLNSFQDIIGTRFSTLRHNRGSTPTRNRIPPPPLRSQEIPHAANNEILDCLWDWLSQVMRLKCCV